MVNETMVTAFFSLVLGVFGKEFWDFWKNRDTIKVQLKLNQRIVSLEKRLLKSTTAVQMLLVYLESKYSEDTKDHDMIEKVRTYLTDDNEDKKNKE